MHHSGFKKTHTLTTAIEIIDLVLARLKSTNGVKSITFIYESGGITSGINMPIDSNDCLREDVPQMIVAGLSAYRDILKEGNK